jgi:hypothetical protein
MESVKPHGYKPMPVNFGFSNAVTAQMRRWFCKIRTLRWCPCYLVPVDEFRNLDNQAASRMSRKILGIAKKKRIAILLKTQLIKEDNDAFES